VDELLNGFLGDQFEHALQMNRDMHSKVWPPIDSYGYFSRQSISVLAPANIPQTFHDYLNFIL
jgi:hypothetical protein